MPIKVSTPTQAQINELRNRFIEKYEQQPPAEPFHPIDIDRVKNEDLWCQLFLEMYDLDLNVSFDKLWETCAWRKLFGANDLHETNVRRDYLEDGVVFTHNKDVDGKSLLIFKTKLHTKGVKDMNEVIRVVVYWVERIHRETHMDKITIIFDMAGTGLSNMDLEFIKRIIDTFKLYYPNALNYILVYEMAWVLNAAFKVIKGILPAKALEILKMITKKDINTYVDKDNCLTSWGGNDDYQFTFVPEKAQKKVAPPQATALKVNGAVDEQGSQDKKVHFANCSPTREPQMTEFEEHHTPQDHDMLRISPTEFIRFIRDDSNECFIELTSVSKFPVTYKIQTTSPEKFRVRPRCGILQPNETTSVSILLKEEHHLSDGSKDKFLIMCAPTPQGTDTQQQLIDLWKQKQSNSPDVEQHRLCCIYKGASEVQTRNGYGHAGDEQSEGKNKINLSDLSKHAKKLEKQLKFTQILQWITIIFLLNLSVAVVYLLKLQVMDGSGEPNPPEAQVADFDCPNGRRL